MLLSNSNSFLNIHDTRKADVEPVISERTNSSSDSELQKKKLLGVNFQTFLHL